MKKIEAEQAEFPLSGYNEEHDYWWARQELGDYEVTRWCVPNCDLD